MPFTEHTLLTKVEFHQHMEGLLASERAISQAFGALVRFAVHVTTYETRGKITADDIAYQLSTGLDGWVISVPNLAKQLPTIRDDYYCSGLGQKSLAAFESLIEGLECAPSSVNLDSKI